MNCIETHAQNFFGFGQMMQVGPAEMLAGVAWAGGVEWGAEPAVAAAREHPEETGLEAPVHALALDLSYALADEPEALRQRFPPGTERVQVGWFRVEAPPAWEPSLDAEHVDLRWCSAAAAVELLFWPEPREAVRAAHAAIGVA
jgi:8-oxo-dGTP pyrophosphatase MutT (NUDIX family)